jgi:hypothetical protein
VNWTEDTPSLNESNANETVAYRGRRFIDVGANVTLPGTQLGFPNNHIDLSVLVTCCAPVEHVLQEHVLQEHALPSHIQHKQLAIPTRTASMVCALARASWPRQPTRFAVHRVGWATFVAIRLLINHVVPTMHFARVTFASLVYVLLPNSLSWQFVNPIPTVQTVYAPRRI